MVDGQLPLRAARREGRGRDIRKWSSRNSLVFIVLASLALWGTLAAAMLGIVPSIAG